jgi:AraC-like DNA-binding protein
MVRVKTEKSKGILNPEVGKKKFHLSLYLPSPDLAFFIEHYWIPSWDLRGQEPYLSENLPYPSVHLVFDKDNTKIFGVITTKFTRRLEGKGRVFGIKFRPGAFYPFVKSPVSHFTNQTISVIDVFGEDGLALEKTILALEDEKEMVELAEAFLRARLPEEDENIALINQIIECIVSHREISKVDGVVRHMGVNKRKLQRLFSQYVGVSPKWVIKRYRLYDAAEKLANGDALDCSRIALDLGYFDQAHFIKDFKTIIGTTPAEYARSLV